MGCIFVPKLVEIQTLMTELKTKKHQCATKLEISTWITLTSKTSNLLWFSKSKNSYRVIEDMEGRKRSNKRTFNGE